MCVGCTLSRVGYYLYYRVSKGTLEVLTFWHTRFPALVVELLASRAKPVFSFSPDVIGGSPVFAGTRVPVQTLLDYLEVGASFNEFLAGFPSVRREQVIVFLEPRPAGRAGRVL